MAEDLQIRLPGQSKFDVIGIEQSVDLIVEEEKIPDSAYGEPTTFLIIVSLAAISSLAAYLLRKHNQESFTETVEVIDPNGRVERRTIHWDKNSVEPPDSSLIK